MHADFAYCLYGKLRQKVPEARIHEIVDEAVKIEMNFCSEALPVSLLGMNADDMREYVKYCADRLFVSLGAKKLYFSKNPFPFMEMQSIATKNNFFEVQDPNYRKSKVGTSEEKRVYSADEDF